MIKLQKSIVASLEIKLTPENRSHMLMPDSDKVCRNTDGITSEWGCYSKSDCAFFDSAYKDSIDHKVRFKTEEFLNMCGRSSKFYC